MSEPQPPTVEDILKSIPEGSFPTLRPLNPFKVEDWERVPYPPHVHIYKRIRQKCNESQVKGGVPKYLLLGYDAYTELCGYIGSIMMAETPVRLSEFEGMKVLMNYGDKDCVEVGGECPK